MQIQAHKVCYPILMLMQSVLHR